MEKMKTKEKMEPKKISRMFERHKIFIKSQFQKVFNYQNIHQFGCLDKIVVSAGFKKGTDVDRYKNYVHIISSQTPVVTKATKSVSQFNIREGMDNGIKVTLRKDRMYNFLDRLLVSLLNWRNFQGFKTRAISVVGSKAQISFGISDIRIFHGITELDGLKSLGINVTFSSNFTTAEELQYYLELLGFPFDTRSNLFVKNHIKGEK